jgi:hypothetical protein
MPAPAPGKVPPIETLSLEERVRRRAYELYVQRGNQSGSDLDDWLRAEQEILHDEAIDEKAAELTGPPAVRPSEVLQVVDNLAPTVEVRNHEKDLIGRIPVGQIVG